MAETLVPVLSQEDKKKKEQFSNFDSGGYEGWGKVEKLRSHATRLRKLGAQVTAASDLGIHRKDIAAKRKEGLKSALGTRKAAVQEAKKELKFAEKGYGRKDRRFETSMEARRQEFALSKERQIAEGGNIFERMAARLERRSLRKEAKGRARTAIAQREKAAADNIAETQYKLDLAQARHDQTREAYKYAKAGLVGNQTGRVAAFLDVNKTQEERLAALRSRDERNFKLDVGEVHAQKIFNAKAAIKELEQEKASQATSAPEAQSNPDKQDGATAA